MLFTRINFQNMKAKFREIEVAPDGKRKWIGGAYIHAFVYSNKGNFLVKGYEREVNEFLKDLKSKGYRYFVNVCSFKQTLYVVVKENKNQRLPVTSRYEKLVADLEETEKKDWHSKFEFEKVSEKWNRWKFSNEKIQIEEPCNFNEGFSWENKGKQYFERSGITFNRRKYDVYVENMDKWKSTDEKPYKILKHLQFKRMPNRWIPEFEELYNIAQQC
jgi:hypothetical protein